MLQFTVYLFAKNIVCYWQACNLKNFSELCPLLSPCSYRKLLPWKVARQNQTIAGKFRKVAEISRDAVEEAYLTYLSKNLIISECNQLSNWEEAIVLLLRGQDILLDAAQEYTGWIYAQIHRWNRLPIGVELTEQTRSLHLTIIWESFKVKVIFIKSMNKHNVIKVMSNKVIPVFS